MAGELDLRISDIEIRANEILADGSGNLDRCLGDRGIWTAGDKLRVMEEMTEQFVGELASRVMDAAEIEERGQLKTVYRRFVY